MKGAELAITARPVPNLTLVGSFSYQDAELAEADPDLGGRKGERLPNVPHFTTTLQGDYVVEAVPLNPTIGATVRFISNRTASFDASTKPQYRLPDYTAVDLRSSVAFKNFDLMLYARNIFDKRGQLSALTTRGVPQVSILQPRTIGLLAKTAF